MHNAYAEGIEFHGEGFRDAVYGGFGGTVEAVPGCCTVCL